MKTNRDYIRHIPALEKKSSQEKIIELAKRSQEERMDIVISLLASIWGEMLQGDREPVLQKAVYAQAFINRIVWRLNKDRDDDKGEEAEDAEIQG